MSFNLPTKTDAKNNAGFEKASGFLNLWVTQADGRRTKVGAIAFRSSNRGEAAILEFLRADPAANAQKLLDALEVDFVDVAAMPDKVTFSL